MNELIISESSTLSPIDRHRVLLEVHGFHPRTTEPSGPIVDTLLDRIRKQASMVRNRKAYNKALFLNPSYTDSPSFLMMFLRSENFNPIKAAHRIVLHFETKLSLFGMDKLATKITHDDLSGDDKLALSTGAIQVLPVKDRSGRTILYETARSLGYRSIQSQLRVHWYMLMSVIETSDPDAQKEGVVRVFYNLDSKAHNILSHNEFIQKGSIFSRALPIKNMGLHFCYNSGSLVPMLSAVQLAVGVDGRSRLRDHFGNEVQVKQKLEDFNIPASALPSVSHDAVSTDYLDQYLLRIKQAEEKERSMTNGEIMQPLSPDVILGRGRHQQEHPGNLRLAQLVDSKRQEYSKLRKLEKSRIIREIVERYESSGGRFVERYEEKGTMQWRESSSDARREKVSQLFRTKTTRNSEFFA
ncbi:unnamed protein product [Cylindrotheca closterium]|uniref:DUF6824 domain-containing protein n=1 Tax=Cylindrotheca closterium TaxID=2856 RepID=A0AAD2FN12_9STRA|nr:unnamed protein product [Cylindrotheca closterium]